MLMKRAQGQETIIKYHTNKKQYNLVFDQEKNEEVEKWEKATLIEYNSHNVFIDWRIHREK